MKFNKTINNLILMTHIILTSCHPYTNFHNKYDNMQVPYSHNIYEKKQDFLENQLTNIPIQQLYNNNIVYFNLNKFNINPEFFSILDIHANFLCSNPYYKVIIEGHTDERGTPEYNIALGERRANSVKAYLQSKGVSSEQIAIISYGQEKPVMLDHNETSYAKNRRAVLVY